MEVLLVSPDFEDERLYRDEDDFYDEQEDILTTEINGLAHRIIHLRDSLMADEENLYVNIIEIINRLTREREDAIDELNYLKRQRYDIDFRYQCYQDWLLLDLDIDIIFEEMLYYNKFKNYLYIRK